MTAVDFVALAPVIVLAATSIAVMLAIAVARHHGATAALTALGLAAALIALPFTAVSRESSRVTALLTLDPYARFYIGLVLAATLATAGLSYGYLEKQTARKEEFYLLLLLASLGAAVLVASGHFASFFLALETLSISLYGLIAYPRVRPASIEAGVKYLILAAVSSAFLLFGMALVYAQAGTMEFIRLAGVPGAVRPGAESTFLVVGFGALLVGIGFKLALVPFHLWTPDVYEGAPAPISGFVATVSKVAVAALLVRLFTLVNIHAYPPLLLSVTAIAFISMVVGNLLALLQNNVKRILAYSSIAHLGYLLVAFLAGGPLGVTAVTFYLVAYTVTNLGAFGVITVLSDGNGDMDRLDQYRAIFWRRPWVIGIFIATLLSLAGMPLTAGFVAKFYLVVAGVGSALWLLVLTLIVTSTVGLFYYLRIIATMFSPEGEAGGVRPTVTPVSLAGAAILAALSVVLLYLGVSPASLIRVIQTAVVGFL
jgi:NADH-quinone oxidoreductase subunit N